MTFFAGLGEKAQTGGGCIPFPFIGSCTGQLNAYILYTPEHKVRLNPCYEMYILCVCVHIALSYCLGYTEGILSLNEPIQFFMRD